MIMDNHGFGHCCGRRCWSWGWGLASPRAFLAQSFCNSRVRSQPITKLVLTDFRSPPTPPILQHILNDTSLTALSFTNGDRQLFFQDNMGRIRRAVRTASNNQWITNLDLSIDSNAKNHTPLAASGQSYTEVATRS